MDHRVNPQPARLNPATLKWNLAQRLEWRWWQWYLKGRKKEDYHKWKKDYWDNILQQIIDLLPANAKFKAGFHHSLLDILDAGCGPAGIFMNLGGHRVDAVDPLIEKYQTSVPLFLPTDFPQVNFINQSLETFESAKQYDVIFCMNAINHVGDMEISLEKLGKLLKDNGLLVVSVDAHRHRFLKLLFKTIPGDMLHPHQYTLEDYLALIGTKSQVQILANSMIKKGSLFNHYLVVCQKNNG